MPSTPSSSAARDPHTASAPYLPRVYISFDPAQDDLVLRLLEDLHTRGFHVEISPSRSHRTSAPRLRPRGLELADAIVLVVSSAYLQSPAALEEMRTILSVASDRYVRSIPLLAGHMRVPEELQRLSPIDFFSGREYGDCLADLLERLRVITGVYPRAVAGPDGGRDLVVTGATPTGGSAGPPAAESPSVAPEPLPISRLHEFYFSPGAERVVQEALKLVGSEWGRGIVLAEDLLFGAAERGRREEGGAPALLWQMIASEGRDEYDQVLRLRFGFDGYAGGEPTSLSAYTVEVLQGAREIAGRISRSDTIESRHLIAALFLVQSANADAMPTVDYAVLLGVPDVELRFLTALQRGLNEGDDLEGWSVLCARKWILAELATERERAAPALPVRNTSVSDAPAREDFLGFAPYVQALAHFLTHPRTVPPLTLSVEGEWGSGKSSFMLQLESEIRRRAPGRGARGRLRRLFTPFREPGAVTVWFNPWRHDKEEALWAAFALKFVDGVKGCMPWGRRLAGNARMFLTRFRWREGWRDVLRLIVMLAAFAALAVVVVRAGQGWSGVVSRVERIGATGKEAKAGGAPPAEGSRDKPGLLSFLLGTGGALAAFVAGVSLWKEMSKLVGDPLRVDLQRYARAPDYERRISFVEQFHRDFSMVLDAYAGDRRVYVFVDDLDRCQVPRAADFMQALNLMVGDDPRVVFVIGMDREKVAASLAVKFKELIPFLGASAWSPAPGDPGSQAVRALEFGSDYIEKFVQIAFRVPQPSDDNIGVLLARLAQDAGAAPSRAAAAWGRPRAAGERAPRAPLAGQASPPRGGTRPAAPSAVPPATPGDAPRRAIMQVSVDSEQVQRIVRTLAPALELNPRRLKQFINIFRLQAYIAASNGRIAHVPGRAGLTLEQIGKLVALGMRWPVLLAQVEASPSLLARLQEVAVGNDEGTAAEHFWVRRPDLLALLRAGMTDPGPEGEARRVAHTLAGVDLTILSQVGAASRPAAS